MALSIYYRKTFNPEELPFAKSDVVLDRPLTMLEIDANMKTIDMAFDSNQEKLDDIHHLLDTKAPIRNPIFRGIVSLPQYANASLLPRQVTGADGAPLIAPVGTLAFTLDNRQIMVLTQNDTLGTKWSAVNTQESMSGYVKKTGDIMTGNLEGTSASWSQNIFALPPGGIIGETQKDVVATVEWTKDTIKDLIDERLNGGSGEEGTQNNIVINKGDLIINNGNINADGNITIDGVFRGNLDMGFLG